MDAPSLWLNNPSTIALSAAGGENVVRQTSQCISVTNELNSFKIQSVRTVHGPSVFVLFFCFGVWLQVCPVSMSPTSSSFLCSKLVWGLFLPLLSLFRLVRLSSSTT